MEEGVGEKLRRQGPKTCRATKFSDPGGLPSMFERHASSVSGILKFTADLLCLDRLENVRRDS